MKPILQSKFNNNQQLQNEEKTRNEIYEPLAYFGSTAKRDDLEQQLNGLGLFSMGTPSAERIVEHQPIQFKEVEQPLKNPIAIQNEI